MKTPALQKELKEIVQIAPATTNLYETIFSLPHRMRASATVKQVLNNMGIGTYTHTPAHSSSVQVLIFFPHSDTEMKTPATVAPK